MFSGYCEGTLSFKPTYKYDVGGSVYDTSYKVYIYIFDPTKHHLQIDPSFLCCL